jgi:hypothetical protein
MQVIPIFYWRIGLPQNLIHTSVGAIAIEEVGKKYGVKHLPSVRFASAEVAKTISREILEKYGEFSQVEEMEIRLSDEGVTSIQWREGRVEERIRIDVYRGETEIMSE